MFITTFYHPEHGARDFSYPDVKAWREDCAAKEKEGWFDTPAKFGMRPVVEQDGRGTRIRYEPINGEIKEQQTLVETFDIASATKGDLERYAKEKHGIDLDKRRKVETLRDEVRALDGDHPHTA